MFLRKQKIKNKDGTFRTYLQVCESVRIDGKPRPIVQMNLGRIDSKEGAERVETLARLIIQSSELFSIFDVDSDFETRWAKNYGFHLVFDKVWKNLKLDELLEKSFADIQPDFDVGEAVYNMTLNRLHSPASKRQLSRWQEKIHDITHYDSHQYYRAMDYLVDHQERLEKSFFANMRLIHDQSVDIVLFDTTTLVYYGEGEKSEELLAHGFSKAKRGDLKQVVIGVVMSKDGIPLAHEVFSGNKNDVTCFKEIIDKISSKFAIKKVILVGDRGMISGKNLLQLQDNGFQYILGYRMRTIPAEDRAAVLSKADLKALRKSGLRWKDVDYNGQRLIVCYNPERAELDKKKREEILERLRKKLKGASIHAVITNPEYKKFLKVSGASPAIDENKVTRDALYDGIFVLTTNTKLDGKVIIERYKDLWQIEAGFRCLKDELQAGPIYHWKDRRIKAHIFICFLALVLRLTLNKELKKQDVDMSYSDVMSDLADLDVVCTQIKTNTIISRTEIKPGAVTALKALEIQTPKKVLKSETKHALVV